MSHGYRRGDDGRREQGGHGGPSNPRQQFVSTEEPPLEFYTPSQSSASSVPNQNVTVLEDKIAKSSTQPLSLDKLKETAVYPHRPGYGSKVKHVHLWTNYFQIGIPKVKQEVVFYRYDLDIQPDAQPKRKIQQAIKLLLTHPEMIALKPTENTALVTDFRKNLIANGELRDGKAVITVNYHDEHEATSSAHPMQFTVKLSYNRSFSMQDILSHVSDGSSLQSDVDRESYLQILNIFTNHYARDTRGLVCIGGKKTFQINTEETKDLGKGLIALRGYYTSARLGTSRLLMNVNVTHGAFYMSCSLLSLMNQYFNAQGKSDVRLERYLQGLIVKVTLPRVKTIASTTQGQLPRSQSTQGGNEIIMIRRIIALAKKADLKDIKSEKQPRLTADYAGPPGVSFWHQQDGGDGGYVSVEKYFRNQYGITTQNRYPVLNCGSRARPVYFPADVCHVLPGQPYKSQLDEDQTKTMMELAVRKPWENARSLDSPGFKTVGLYDGLTGVVLVGESNPTTQSNQSEASATTQSNQSEQRNQGPKKRGKKHKGGAFGRENKESQGSQAGSSNQTGQTVQTGQTGPASSATGSSTAVQDSSVNQLLRDFGLHFRNELITVQARVLNPPSVLYKAANGSSAFKLTPQHGSWNMKDIKVTVPGPLGWRGFFRNWRFIIISMDGKSGLLSAEAYKKILDEFVAVAAGAGINIGYPLLGQTLVTPNKLGDFIDDARKSKLFLLIRIPKKNHPIYAKIKYFGDVVHGVPTICMGEGISKERGQKNYIANVLLKMNLKLGGTNQKVTGGAMKLIEDGKTMLVGIDVTHPAPGSEERSVSGMVASIDGDLGQWPATLHYQNEKGQEEVDHLQDMLERHLKLWQDKNRSLPQNIIVYRDGVSEGQYSMVMKKEYPQLQKACKRLYKQAQQSEPYMTIAIVGKRHHTRFYPQAAEQADRSGNCVAGTVVDRGVTEARNWDFFLQPHSAIKGTAKPAHYFVVHDEVFRGRYGQKKLADEKFANVADVFEEFTHSLSYGYGRATKAVRVCPPARYADMACDRARVWLKAERELNLDVLAQRIQAGLIAKKSDESGEEAGAEKAEKATGEKSSGKKSTGKKPAGKQPAVEQAGEEKAGEEKAGEEKAEEGKVVGNLHLVEHESIMNTMFYV